MNRQNPNKSKRKYLGGGRRQIKATTHLREMSEMDHLDGPKWLV